MRRVFGRFAACLGRPACSVALAAVASGVGVGLSDAPPASDLTFWTFAATHAEALRDSDATPAGGALDVHHAATGRLPTIRVLDRRAMDVRIGTLSAGAGDGLPDVVQLDVASATRWLDAADPPFVPLDGLIDPALLARFRPERLDMWRRDGRLYGLPADVHPTALAYRVDLWAEVGLDPTSARTWDEFADLCRRYTSARRARGEPHRAALELVATRGDHLTLWLQQAGHDFDQTPETPEVRAAVLLAAGLLADGSARETSAGHGRWAADFAAGDVATLWLPDWRGAYLRASAPSLAGRVAVMPLPHWRAGGPATAGWGATMLAIPRGVPDVEAAAALLETVAASDAAVAGRTRRTDMVPPLTPHAGDAREPDDYFLTGSPRSLFGRLAQDVRLPKHDARFLATSAHLGDVLTRTTADIRRGLPAEEVGRRLRARLTSAGRDLDRRVR